MGYWHNNGQWAYFKTKITKAQQKHSIETPTYIFLTPQKTKTLSIIWLNKFGKIISTS